MRPLLAAAALALLSAGPTLAQVDPFPPSFTARNVPVGNGVTLHVRTGGSGPAVVLLHGYTQTGDMWAPLADALDETHTVIVPDLRGLGLSSRPEGGYDKATQAGDIVAVLDALGVESAAVIGHDIGNMVGYALADRHGDRVTRLAVMDAPVPGIGPWDDVIRARALWHFSFGGPDAERLVAGRERIYLDRFWNEFAADPAKLTDEIRDHYAGLYAAPGGMRAGFAQFLAFPQDAEDNRATADTPLSVPVLAVGGEHSFAGVMAAVMETVAPDVTAVVIPGAGHWLMEEAPEETITAVVDFLRAD